MLVKLVATTGRTRRVSSTVDEISVAVFQENFGEDSVGDDSDGDETPQPTAVDTFSLSGFVQVIILYFQVASLLRVKYQKS